MWGRTIEAVYKNKFNLILTALMLIVLLVTILPRVDSVGSVKFRRQQSGIEKMQSDVSDGYWQVRRDAKREAVRTNVTVEYLAFRKFVEFAGDSAGATPEVYKELVHRILSEVIEDYTVKAVLRNHYPVKADTTSEEKHQENIDEHTTRIAIAGALLARSHVESNWHRLLPSVDGKKYANFLKHSGLNEDILSIKKESLVRTEVQKMEIVTNLLVLYPELTEAGVKARWGAR